MTRRETTKFAALALLMAALFSACALPEDDKGTSTAGVLTETESGHTIAFNTGYSWDYDLPKSAKVTYTLARIVDGKTEFYDSVTVDAHEYAVFEDVKGAYSVIASTEGFAGAQILKTNDEDSIYVRLQKPATLKLSVDYDSLSVGDTICITGLLKCKQITKSDAKNGYAIIENIPIVENDEGEKTIEIYNGKKLVTKDVFWNFKEDDTLFVNNYANANILYSLDFSLPEFDLLDSLDDSQLDSLLVPLKEKGNHDKSMPYYEHDYSEVFLDEQGNVVSSQGGDWVSEDSIMYWVALPHISTTAKLTAVAGEIQWQNFDRADSRLRQFVASPATDTVLDMRYDNSVFTEDSSVAISFWFELENLAEDATLLSAGSDSLGFNIRRCSKDSTALCARVYNGIDSASTDSVEYGKAAVLDGKRHHYSLAIHKKHLVIAIDGKTIRDTDLKLSEDFYGIKDIQIGETPLQNLALYSFGDFIKHKNDKNWNRLKAWLYAFYEIQK
ncbi:hypothetical protein [Fibrobacter sp.]|uniref:hypothetical protein n=1 Tax=Fibrobacter sp. TaxID=35828 RepID=UPI003890EBCC